MSMRAVLVSVAMSAACAHGHVSPPAKAEVARAPTASLELRCDQGMNAACLEAGRAYLEHPSSRGRNWYRAVRLFRIGCARGDGRACAELATLWSREENGDRVTDAYAARSCGLGDAVGCAIEGLRSVLEHRAPAELDRACSAGDEEACTWGVTLAPDLEVHTSFAKRETALVLRACDAGRADACAKLAGWSGSGFEGPTRGLDATGVPSAVHFAARACALGDLGACLGLLDLDGPIIHAPDDPDLASIMRAKETACAAGSAAACAWRSTFELVARGAWQPWQVRARGAAAAVCNGEHPAACDDAMDALVDLGDPRKIGSTLELPGDDACAHGSLIACFDVIATAFADGAEPRIAAAFRTANELGSRECAADPLLCAAHARLLFAATRFDGRLTERGAALARDMYRAACSRPETAIACLDGAGLATDPADRAQLLAAFRRFEGPTCDGLQRACGGTQCDPMCLMPDTLAPR